MRHFYKIKILLFSLLIAVPFYSNGSKLHSAILNGETTEALRIIDELVSTNDSIYFIDTKIHASKATPLHLAAQEGNLEVIRKLVEAGANINQVDMGERKEPALFWAIRAGKSKSAVELIKLGTDLVFSNRKEWTALHLASYLRDSRVVKALLKKETGSLLNRENGNGIKALHLAQMQNGDNENMEVIRLLKRKGAEEGFGIAFIDRRLFANDPSYPSTCVKPFENK